MKKATTIIISLIVGYICLSFFNNTLSWLFDLDPESRHIPLYLKWYEGYLMYYDCWSHNGWMDAPFLYILPVFITLYLVFIQFIGYIFCQLLFSKIFNMEPAL